MSELLLGAALLVGLLMYQSRKTAAVPATEEPPAETPPVELAVRSEDGEQPNKLHSATRANGVPIAVTTNHAANDPHLPALNAFAPGTLEAEAKITRARLVLDH